MLSHSKDLLFYIVIRSTLLLLAEEDSFQRLAHLHVMFRSNAMLLENISSLSVLLLP